MNRYALRDDQWERIKDLLPGKPGDVGVTAHDNRRFVEAVLYRYRTGIPWRDLPEGPPSTRLGKIEQRPARSTNTPPDREFRLQAQTAPRHRTRYNKTAR